MICSLDVPKDPPRNVAGRLRRRGSFGTSSVASNVGRLYSSTRIEAAPQVAHRTLHDPSARPAGIANSPATDPYAFDETGFASTACPFASTSVSVTGVWGVTRHRARSPRPLKTTAFQSTF